MPYVLPYCFYISICLSLSSAVLCACTPCYCGSMNLMIVMILRHLTCNSLKRQYCQMGQELCLGSDIMEHSCWSEPNFCIALGSPVHEAPACAGFGEGSDHFGSFVRSLSLHFCKRLFPGLEPVTIHPWPHGHKATALPLLHSIALKFILPWLPYYQYMFPPYLHTRHMLWFVFLLCRDCFSKDNCSNCI